MSGIPNAGWEVRVWDRRGEDLIMNELYERVSWGKSISVWKQTYE